MFLDKYNKKDSLFDLNIVFISFIIVLIKWFLSFNIYDDENLINKILFDISDIHYLPFIFNILDLDFSPEYLNSTISKNFIPIPIYSIFIHAIFYKIFDIYSFLILEGIFLYIFLLINLKILVYCKVNYFLSLFTSLFIFVFPSIVSNIQLFGINLNVLDGIFNFRFPRPLVTSCYFFWGIYLALIYFINDKFSFKNFLLIGLCLSLIFVSYYYNFISLFILFLFLFINKIFNKIDYIKNYYLKILTSILVFLILTIPYLYLYTLSEKDFLSMIGVISLNFDLKIQLLSYFLLKLLTLKFILVFFLITISRFFLLRFKDKINKNIINFFYLIFMATLLSPFFFTIISPSISEIYHFLNWILIISIFVLMIYSCLFINLITKNILLKSFKIYKNFFIFSSIFLIIIFEFINFEKFSNDNDKNLRKDYIELQNYIDKNSNKIENLLSFSIRPQVLWMLKEKNQFSSIESSISSLNFDQLEKNFIQNLKFLNISSNDFLMIISNDKGTWRYKNDYLKYISWYKYQANSLITYDNSKDFTDDENEFIKKSSPTKTQQIIIPKFEIDRLITLFNNSELKTNYNKPDLIVLDKQSLISEFSLIDNKIYCELNDYKTLKIYVLNELNTCT